MKEINREVLDRGSLAELLTQRARQASDLRLVLDAAIGFAGAGALVVLQVPLRLPLAALALALGSFGAWGILDRELTDSVPGSKKTLVVARSIVAALGVLAAVLGGVGVFFGLLGTWIS